MRGVPLSLSPQSNVSIGDMASVELRMDCQLNVVRAFSRNASHCGTKGRVRFRRFRNQER